METLRIRYTRGDYCTLPGGVILRKREQSGRTEYIVHSFSRERGSKEPTSFFWGNYVWDDEKKANAAFNEKLNKAKRYDLGGSLIEDYQLEAELKKELEHDDA